MSNAWLKKCLVAVGIVGLVYLGASFKLYRDLATIPGGEGLSVGNTPAHFMKDPEGQSFRLGHAYEMPHYEEVRIPSVVPGKTLSAWVVQAKLDAPAIIISHGYTSSKADVRVLMMAGMLAKHGFSVLMLDLRNHGKSDRFTGRTAMGNTEYQDILSAKKWLISHGVSPQKIGVAGGSMGAATVLIAAYKDPEIKGVFADSPFSTLPSMIQEELARRHLPTWLMPGGVVIAWLHGDHFLAFSPKDSVKNAHSPIFLTHSQNDSRVFFSHALILNAEPHPKAFTFWPTSYPGHCREILVHPDVYEKKLVGFFAGVFR